MTKGKGYLLPPGDATEDELECCLVFYPARDEYRRALMGSLDYLATWIAWERDSEKRGQDAAASWKLANIQTWECCSMGFCDDLTTTLQELLAAIQALECCGEQDITDGQQYTDEIVDGVGDVPQNIIDAGYADDAADWDGFDDYKCMISHLAVDHVESFFSQIAPFISETGIVIGGVGVVGALVGGILTLAGLPISAGIIIALGAAAAIWTWITSEGRQAVEDLADEIATNHDALACAIYHGDGVTDAISDFNDEVDSLFNPIDAAAIKALGIEPQLRALYSGRYDQDNIAQSIADLGYQVTSFDCSCPITFEVTMEYDFDAGTQGWFDNGRVAYRVQGYGCNSEQAGYSFHARDNEGAILEETLQDMFIFHSESPPTGSERFFIQYVQFYWRPCPLVNQDPYFRLHTSSYQPEDFDRTVAGYYEKSFSGGNEPEMEAGWEIGIRAPIQGGSTAPDYWGFVYKYKVGGFVAEGS